MKNSYPQQQARNNVAFGTIIKNAIPEALKAGDEMKRGFVCVVSGPSGVGKDTVLNAFKGKFKDFFSRVVTCTTREPRPGEVNGVNYHFLSNDEFRKGVANNEFAEYVCNFSGRYYGTRKADIDNAIATGKNVVMAIDVDGAMNIKKSRSDVLMMFFTPPSMQELEARLIGRGTETMEAVAERLGKARKELSFQDQYDVIIQNDDFNKSVDEMAEVFHIKK
ncbi:MAG: guanylate kinase [Fusobacterium sp.]|nr:guanylate kinase [Fusobacterium sp.]